MSTKTSTTNNLTVYITDTPVTHNIWALNHNQTPWSDKSITLQEK